MASIFFISSRYGAKLQLFLETKVKYEKKVGKTSNNSKKLLTFAALYHQ